jgi:hypothetical protein
LSGILARATTKDAGLGGRNLTFDLQDRAVVLCADSAGEISVDAERDTSFKVGWQRKGVKR